MAPPTKIRPSKNARKRAVVLLLVHALIAVHIAHWLSAGESMSPLEPSEAMEFSKHSIVNAGLIFFALTILSTLVLGRWFCGWACHLVALQDLSLWLLRKFGIKPRPMRSRLLGAVPMIAALYMFVYPLGYRLWKGAEITTFEVLLTKKEFWGTFPPWIVATATFFVCGFVTIYFLGAKGFCTYACPYGAFFGLADKFAVGRIRVTDACAGCAHCTATCTSNVVVHEEVRDHGMVVDPGCMKCLDCVSVCPTNALYFGFGKPSLLTKGKPAKSSKGAYTWGEELLLALAFVVAFLVYRGLYGAIPFLLALAVAGVVAYLMVATTRLFHKPGLSVGSWKVKANGGLTRRGRWFVGGMVGLSALTLHSGFIQLNARLSERGEGETALRRAQLVHRYGLLSTPGNVSLRADLFASLGRPGEAVRALEEELARRPTAPLFDRLARLQYQGGRPDLTLATYRRAVAWDPEASDLRYNLGVAAASLMETEEAIAAFRVAADLDPDRIEALENLAGGLAATGRFREALDAYERILVLRPGDPGILEALVAAHLALQEPEAARERLARVLEAGEASEATIQSLLGRLESPGAPGDPRDQ